MLMNFSLSGKVVLFFLLLASVSTWMLVFDQAFTPWQAGRWMAIKAAAVLSIGLHLFLVFGLVAARMFLPGLLGKPWS